MKFNFAVSALLWGISLYSTFDGSDAWIDCEELIDHIGVIIHPARHPRTFRGYSKGVCRSVLNHYKEHEPKKLEGIVNLSNHIQKGRELKPDAKIENVAQARRNLLEPGSCNEQDGVAYEYKMGNPGFGSNTTGIPVGQCPREACPTFDNPEVQPEICIPNSANNTFYNAKSLYPPDSESVGGFEESDIEALYPSGVGYDIWTFDLKILPTVLDAISPTVNDYAQEVLPWSGCNQDRVGNYDTLAIFLRTLLLEKLALEFAEVICKFTDDRIEFAVLFAVIAVPHPGKVICAVGIAVLKAVEIGLQRIYDQINTQNGWVDNAEIQAGYENSVTLLDKQCGTFYEAACRCSTGTPKGEEGPGTGAYGVGCDGLDSDCDGDPDNCEEDKFPPQIDIKSTVAACGSGRWFQFEDDAIECVKQTVSASDDCNGVSEPVVTRKPNTTCADTIFEITVTQERCAEFGGNTTVEQNIFVDDELPPVVTCSVGTDGETGTIVEETGPGVLKAVPLSYSAQDGFADDTCGISSLNVTVYSNELENFNAQKMAVFFGSSEDGATKSLYIATAICANDSNGQCIKDPELQGARLYTVVVDAEDLAGRQGSAECIILVVPAQGKPYTLSDAEKSVQRFPVAVDSGSVFPAPY